MLNGLLIILFLIISIDCFSQYDSCFSKHPNYYLEQSGRLQLKNLTNKASCLKACIMSEVQYGFYCKTVMWQNNLSNCILSRWSIAQQRSRLRKSISGDIDLYSNHCVIKTSINKNVAPSPSPTRDIRHVLEYQQNSLRRSEPLKTSEAESHSGISHAEALHESSEIVSATVDNFTQKEIIDKSINSKKSVETLQPWQMEAMRNVAIKKHHHPLLSVFATTFPPPKSTTTAVSSSSVIPQRTTVSIKSRQSRNLIDRDSTASLISSTKNELSSSFSSDNFKLFSPCFRLNRKYALRGFAEKLLQGIGLEECLMNCLKNTQFYCASINYNEKNMICILNGGNSRLNHASIETNNNMDYYENLCSPISTVSQKALNSQIIISEEILKRCVFGTKDSTLLSLTGDIQPETPSLAHCISLCLLAKTHKNRECTAVNWLGNMKSCTLFYEIVDNKLISSSPSSYFYENQCSAEIFGEKRKNEMKKEDFDYS